MISCQADDLNSEDSDQFSYDEDMKPKVNLDDGPDFGDIPLQDQKRDSLVNSIQTDEGMGADLKNKIAAALITDLTSINKAEDKKLLKYRKKIIFFPIYTIVIHTEQRINCVRFFNLINL